MKQIMITGLLDWKKSCARGMVLWMVFQGLFMLSHQDCLAYDFQVNGIYYNIISATQNTVEVTYNSKHTWNGNEYYACNYSGYIKIPSSVQYMGITYKVLGIGEHAFSTEAGNEWADPYKKRLTSITISEGIEYLKECALYHCDGLSYIYLPSTIKELDSGAISGSDLKWMFFKGGEPPHIVSLPNVEIIVPQKQLYLTDSEWSKYENQLIEMVTFDSSNLVYDGKSHVLPWTSNLKNFDVEILNNQTSINAGNNIAKISYSCSVSDVVVAEGTFNYRYEIAKAPLNVNIGNAQRIYGEANPEFSYTMSGYVNGENEDVVLIQPTMTTTANAKSDVGEYTITGVGGEADNYSFNFIDGKLTVSKAPLSAEVQHTTREYGNANPSFSLNYQGLKNGETVPAWIDKPVYSTVATQGSAIGDYSVTATATPKNYELLDIASGILTITPATLKVTAQNKSRLYYENNPELTCSFSGFKNGEKETVLNSLPVVSTTANLNSDAGKYEITASGASAQNYKMTYQAGTLTVNPRTLSVKVGNYERPYGEDNPEFELSYDGFVGKDGTEDLTKVPSAYTSATKSSGVGSYPINISGGEAMNYSFKYTSGYLEIIKADQEIIWNQDLSNLEVGQQIELLAYSTSELPITYIMDDNGVCEMYSIGNKKYLDCIGKGEIRIRASQDGDKNHNPAVRASKTVKVFDTMGVFGINQSSPKAAYLDLSGKLVVNPKERQPIIKIEGGKSRKILMRNLPVM